MRAIRYAWVMVLLTASGAAVADVAPAETANAVRSEFTAALQRVRDGQPDQPDSAALRAYAIYDYLVAARLQRNLTVAPDDALDGTIDGFLKAHDGQPVTHALRRAWLSSLAARSRWDWFLPRSLDVTDAALLCDRLAGRLVTGDTQGLAAEALALWSQPQRPPAECRIPFAWLHTQNVITSPLAQARLRAVLVAGNVRLARELAVEVSADQASDLLLWEQLLETPESSVSVLAAHPRTAVSPEALLAGFTKLANTDSQQALSLLPALLKRPDMTPLLQAQLQRSAALGAAYDHAPAALAAFRSLPGQAVNDDVYEWRVRAALWQRDYAQALIWIDSMPPALAVLPRWRYWRARAMAATGDLPGAAAAFAQLATLRDYYGYLAADQVQQTYQLNAQTLPVDEEALGALETQPALIRAHELFDCDLTDAADEEWASVIANAAPATKVQAAELAARWSWYAQAIATLAQTGQFDDVRLRYPRPYADLVAQASLLTQLPSEWIFAVMRQESLFRKDVISSAGARGLMQLEPSTAGAVARRWRMPTPSGSALLQPVLAIPLGAAHLRDLLDYYMGNLSVGLAAYNAGLTPVARWQPRSPTDADVWIENIPYAETRAYVQRIFEHIVAYYWVRGVDPPRLGMLMMPVGSTPTGDPSNSLPPSPAAASSGSISSSTP